MIYIGQESEGRLLLIFEVGHYWLQMHTGNSRQNSKNSFWKLKLTFRGMRENKIIKCLIKTTKGRKRK